MSWAEANQRYLVARLAAIGERLDQYAGGEPAGPLSEEVRRDIDAAAGQLDDPAAIDRLTGLFGLSPFERDTLLLLAGVELDAAFAARCAATGGDVSAGAPTFGLALAALPDAHWSALSPSAPLRYWRMVELGPGSALTTAGLRIDERILHHLTGIDLLDERLEGFVGSVDAEDALPPEPAGALAPEHAGALAASQAAIAERLVQVWQFGGNGTPESVVHLTGPDPHAMARIAAAAAAQIRMRLFRLHDDDIPSATAERELLTRLWERDAILSGRVLLLTHGDGEASSRAAHMADALRTPVVLAGRDGFELRDRSSIPIEVGRPSADEQRALWNGAIPPAVRPPDTDIDAVVRQFAFGADRIRQAALDFTSRAASSPSARLWDSALAHARPRGETLAQRIDARATWADLVLGERQTAMLQRIAGQVRHRATVYEDWGFRARESRGLGISALFIGRSGTGKTLAAEVLANELALDLYRIDLSSVVSKYIGETEKNLRRVFDDAENGGSILLFDEADALFGKRSEVRDSHDRYANIEVSYLLQRMEAYRGLAILTTNMKDALDPAFLRRIRFVVDFRHPDHELRKRIWSQVFPAATPVDGLAPEDLAQLSVPGGNIRNVALNAAFLAAADDTHVTMGHLARAARDEFEKLDRSLSEDVIRTWS